MAVTVTNLADSFEDWRVNLNLVHSQQGDLTSLTTTDKSSIVAAINEVASASLSDAEVKTAYENNADTNAFTDAEQTKLGAIEASADVTDATNVAAAEAFMNGDVTANGRVVRTGAGAYTTVYDKLDATTAPGVTNDIDELYVPGSLWVDVTGDEAYVCLDNTDGAAVWIELTSVSATASDTVAGIVERSTSAENITGTADDKYPTVLGAKEIVDVHSTPGVADILTAKTTNSDVTIQGNGTGVPDIETGFKVGGTVEKLTGVSPGTDGNVLTSDGTDWVSETPAGSGGFTQGTEQSTTSGSSKTFSGIPAGTKMIVIMLASVSTSGTSTFNVTIGDSGGIETSGYLSAGGQMAGGGQSINWNTTQFEINSTVAADTLQGSITLTLEDTTNTWTCTHTLNTTGVADILFGSGVKSLSTTLTQVRFGTSGTFDAGAVNIMYQ